MKININEVKKRMVEMMIEWENLEDERTLHDCLVQEYEWLDGDLWIYPYCTEIRMAIIDNMLHKDPKSINDLTILNRKRKLEKIEMINQKI